MGSTLRIATKALVAGVVVGIGMGPAALAAACDDVAGTPATTVSAPADRQHDGDQWDHDRDSGDRWSHDDASDEDTAAPDATATEAPATDAPDQPLAAPGTVAPTLGADGAPSSGGQRSDRAATDDDRDDADAEDTPSTSPAPATPPPGSPMVVIDTGAATASGNTTNDSIIQSVMALATDAARIELLQIALVINIGLASAQSGGNAAGVVVAPVGPAGAATISSGTATATGNTGATRVVQAIVLSGDQQSGQSAKVLTFGIGVASTGGNVVTGTTAGGGANIATGAADATGNRSTSRIIQIASVTAADDGVLRAVQRAVIVNLGGAGLAETGDNGAVHVTGISDRQLVFALLSALARLQQPQAAGGATGAAGALATGAATAVGNATTTEVLQRIDGSVGAGDDARAIQDAFVGNIGLAVATSGGNSVGLSALDLLPGQLEEALASISGFVAGLGTGDGAARSGLDETFRLGDASLDVDGSVDRTTALLGPDSLEDFGAGGAQVLVRQVSAVLNLSFGFADSGDNVVDVVRTDARLADATRAGNGSATAGTAAATAPAASAVGAGAGGAIASIVTGPAEAVGNRFIISVCQADQSPACDPPVVDPAVGDPGSEVDASVVRATPRRVTTPRVSGSALPNTGADLGTPVTVGVVLLIAGGALLVTSRRRRIAARD